MQLCIQLAQVRRHRGDEDLHSGVGRADLETGLVGEHGQHCGGDGAEHVKDTKLKAQDHARL